MQACKQQSTPSSSYPTPSPHRSILVVIVIVATLPPAALLLLLRRRRPRRALLRKGRRRSGAAASSTSPVECEPEDVQQVQEQVELLSWQRRCAPRSGHLQAPPVEGNKHGRPQPPDFPLLLPLPCCSSPGRAPSLKVLAAGRCRGVSTLLLVLQLRLREPKRRRQASLC